MIFDCDGVLVDSEHITSEVFARMLGEAGFNVTPDYMFEHFTGKPLAACLEMIEQLYGRKVPVGFEEAYHRQTIGELRARLLPVEGVAEIVQKLRVPFCVASSGEHEKMRATLGATGLLPYFEGKLFSVTDVERGKPFPDVFLYAARSNGVDPRRCAAVEDSPPGVQAAHTACMTVFGYAKNTPAHRLQSAGAHVTFEDMQGLATLLAAAGAL